MGSVVDATRGKVRVRTARKGRGLDEGTFWKGAFGILQDRQEAVTEMFLQGESGSVAMLLHAPTTHDRPASVGRVETIRSGRGGFVFRRRGRWGAGRGG